jgi:hypothetical protein
LLKLDPNLQLGIAAKLGHVLLLPQSSKKNAMIFTLSSFSNRHYARNNPHPVIPSNCPALGLLQASSPFEGSMVC